MGTGSEELLEEMSAAINFAYNQTEHKDEMLSTRLNYDEGTISIVGDRASIVIVPTDAEYLIKYSGREEVFSDKIKAAERSVEIFVDEEDM
jgi:hypothetical protein